MRNLFLWHLLQSSCKSFTLLIDAIVNQDAVSLACHLAHLDMVHAAAVTRSHEDQYQLFSSLLSCLPSLSIVVLFSVLSIFTLLAG